MILSEIKHYLAARGQATLGEIAVHFDTPPDAIRGMLEQWIRKGKVRRFGATSACGSSCSKCDPAMTEVYQWIGSPAGGRHLRGIQVKPIGCDH